MPLPRLRPVAAGDAGYYFVTDDGAVVDNGNKYELLVAPQTVLEPLGLTSVRNAMAGSPDFSDRTLFFSPGGPEEFDDRYPNARADIRLEVLEDGVIAATVTTEEAWWDDDRPAREETTRRLLAPLVRRNSANAAKVGTSWRATRPTSPPAP